MPASECSSAARRSALRTRCAVSAGLSREAGCASRQKPRKQSSPSDSSTASLRQSASTSPAESRSSCGGGGGLDEAAPFRRATPRASSSRESRPHPRTSIASNAALSDAASRRPLGSPTNARDTASRTTRDANSARAAASTAGPPPAHITFKSQIQNTAS